MRFLSFRFLVVCLALGASGLFCLAEDSERKESLRLDQLEEYAIKAGFAGDDLSPALGLDRPDTTPSWLVERPADASDLQFTQAKPALRVHVPGEAGRRLPDRDGDGIPDRVQQAIDVAGRTLRLCASSKLGAPADDGDAEIDIYLLPLAGKVRGYTVLEQALPAGQGATGFAVIDMSSRQDASAFAGMVSRTLTRLVLASRNASAPSWWTEASVSWIQARIAGPSFDLHRAIEARWNHPELGLDAEDPILGRGNVAMLWSIEDSRLEERTLVASWNALAAASGIDDEFEGINAALRRTTGLDLQALQLRAATAYFGAGLEPARYSQRVEALPAISKRPDLPIATHGLGLISILPDPREPEGTLLTLESDGGDWSATLLALRSEGRWDQTQLHAVEDTLSVTIPWQDYERAVLLLHRSDGNDGPASYQLHAESTGPTGPFAFSSLAARRRPDGFVKLSWSSAWERGLFGWLVEQAPSPDGPWRLVQDIPLPALGLPGEGTGYSLLERRSTGDFPSYYRVVAVTTDGLRATGPVVAAGL